MRDRYRANTSKGTLLKRVPVLGSRTERARTLPKTLVWKRVIITVVPAFNFGPVNPW